MSKAKKLVDNGQMSLFDVIKRVEEQQQALCPRDEAPGRFDIAASLKAMISDALKRSPLSREQVAAEMSMKTGVEITKSMIDSWSAESKENHRFPLAYLPAFIAVTGDRAILRLICELVGGFYIEGPEALSLELGKIMVKKQELSKMEKTVRSWLDAFKGKDGSL